MKFVDYGFCKSTRFTLTTPPQLLLLDEPLSNLDATLRLNMRTEIKRLQRQFKLTTILVTHDQMEATTMADRVVCMSKGKIEQIGTPEDLYLRPASLFVATFIGAPSINQFDGEVIDGEIKIGGISLPVSGGATGQVKLGLRPEHLRFSDKGIAGRVDQIEPMGRETLYVVETAMGLIRVLDMNANIRFAIDTDVSIDFDEIDSLLFDKETQQLIEGGRVRFA